MNEEGEFNSWKSEAHLIAGNRKLRDFMYVPKVTQRIMLKLGSKSERSGSRAWVIATNILLGLVWLPPFYR